MKEEKNPSFERLLQALGVSLRRPSLEAHGTVTWCQASDLGLAPPSPTGTATSASRRWMFGFLAVGNTAQ